MKINEVRNLFLDYFKGKGHTVVPSSNLIPKKDPTLLFTNAGMNQFKDVFLGMDTRDYRRAASCQKCVRAGGKHNDLENVGFTYRHHTFFEMLGNFSFGDYFKDDAIKFAWELLTDVYGIPKDKLYITVYKDDDEAYEIWNKKIGIAKERIFKMGEKDNFWSMGDTGPCGPCSEIYYDHGADHGCGKPNCTVGCDCDRYVEIWNLVFMQFNRDEKGKMTKLPKPSIDTGAGLERLTAVMQGVASNYDIDLFKDIKKEIQKDAPIAPKDKHHEASYNAIADHLRSIAFLISDGCFPSNEGAGYVLRRIIRRAIRHGKVIGFNSPFLHGKISVVCDLMGDAYPELKKSKKEIDKILKTEEEKFYETLDKGLGLLEKELSGVSAKGILSGQTAFKLYDTFGFPLDLTQLICRERDVSVDEKGFNEEMEKQRKMARDARTKCSAVSSHISEADIEVIKKDFASISSEFTGYEAYASKSKCVAIVKGGALSESVSKGEKAVLVFDRTPFYAESGGQTADTGEIFVNGVKAADVVTVQKPVGGIHLHLVDNVSGTISKGKDCELRISSDTRKLTERNHTATHMLHNLLRKKLGDHVKQSGSLVNNEFFTFDFSHYEKVSNDQLQEIEQELNLWILRGEEVDFEYKNYKDAVNDGAMALFDEKYGDKVRVVMVGEESVELCGGTHVKNTSEIGIFKILAEESTGAGIRRIRATTSFNAYQELSQTSRSVKETCTELRCADHELLEKTKQVLLEYKQLRKDYDDLKSSSAKVILDEAVICADVINGLKFVFADLTGSSAKDLREHAEYLKSKGSDISVLFSEVEGKSSVVVSVSKSGSTKVPASEIMKYIVSNAGGKGGGNPEYVQGGGSDHQKLKVMKEDIKDFISKK